MSLSDYIEPFLAQIQCSSTCRAYGKHLHGFVESMQDKSMQEAFCRNSANEHIAQLRSSADSISTKNQKLAAIRAFGRFLFEDEIIAENAFLSFSYFKNDTTTEKSHLSIDELRRCAAHLDSRVGLLAERDSLMFKLLYSSGLKVSELIGLKVDDVDLKNGLLQVGNRTVPVYPDLLGSLEKYLRTNVGQKEDFVFVSEEGQRLSRNYLFRRVRKVGLEVGIPLSPTLLRNSFAAIAFGQGVALSDLQAILGHKNLQTTSRIVGYNGTQRKRLHRRFHPRNKVSH